MHGDEPCDLLIAGAGPVGCVIAERAATQIGWTSLIVEKREHIAGNCYDREHESGVLIHQYGPHYFRTDNELLLAYLSQFTEWVEGRYVVKSHVRGELFPFPINLDTLEQFFRRSFTAEEAEAFLEQIREKIDDPKNSEDFVLSRVGRELYEAFYLGYTLKQWGRHPRELAPSVCGRIPVRLDRDARYVGQRFQVTPMEGVASTVRRDDGAGPPQREEVARDLAVIHGDRADAVGARRCISAQSHRPCRTRSRRGVYRRHRDGRKATVWQPRQERSSPQVFPNSTPASRVPRTADGGRR